MRGAFLSADQQKKKHSTPLHSTALRRAEDLSRSLMLLRGFSSPSLSSDSSRLLKEPFPFIPFICTDYRERQKVPRSLRGSSGPSTSSTSLRRGSSAVGSCGQTPGHARRRGGPESPPEPGSGVCAGPPVGRRRKRAAD